MTARPFAALALGALTLTACRKDAADPAALPETNPTATAATPPAAGCGYDATVAPVAAWPTLVSPSDPSKGAADAAVTVVEFFEPNCPHCASLHPAMQAVSASHADRARFVFKPVVFWPKSLTQAQALYAAQADGKFFEMLDLQMTGQKPDTGLSPDDLRGMAASVGMNGEAMLQRIEAGDYRMAMTAQREAFTQTGVTSVPLVLINGRAVGGDRSPACLGKLIDEAAAAPAGPAAPADTAAAPSA